MSVKIVECPRDAMQGFHNPISTDIKIEYLNTLLKVGFDTIDCGSFVSSKVVPQLADTAEVLKNIDAVKNNTKLLCIIANERGADLASDFSNIDVLGFPFSISETFQLRNTNQTIKQASERLKNIQKITSDSNKQLLVYLSMGFGNPYKDDWSSEYASEWCQRLADIGITMINLSDTIGTAKPEDIKSVFSFCNNNIPQVEFGAHFHTRFDNYLINISTAYDNHCRKFDSAIKGFGGCPFAADKLTGNLPTESLLLYLDSIDETTNIDKDAFNTAYQMAANVFTD